MPVELTPSIKDTLPTCRMDGRVIRSLGIQKFLDHCADIPHSNIDFFATKQQLEQRWNECNFGCHGPSYRVLYRQSTYTEVLEFLNKIDPTYGYATGVIDSTITNTSKIVKGGERTAEGLGVSGTDRIAEIGRENSLAFNLAKDALVKAFSLSLTLVDNPFTALIINIVTTYIKYVPDEIIVQMAAHGKFKNIEIDMNMTIQATTKGLTNIDLSGLEISELKLVGEYLKNNPQFLLKLLGKYHGRKLVNYIATHIAIAIARQIAVGMSKSFRYKRFLKTVKPSKTTKNLAGVVIFLLKTQGLLQEASNASKRLHNRSPKLWLKLRQQQGLDMIYFFIEDYITEYVDRIGLAERNPDRFIEMVVAILKPPGTIDDLFFPFKKKS
jgi:hypothetical protein